MEYISLHFFVQHVHFYQHHVSHQDGLARLLQAVSKPVSPEALLTGWKKADEKVWLWEADRQVAAAFEATGVMALGVPSGSETKSELLEVTSRRDFSDFIKVRTKHGDQEFLALLLLPQVISVISILHFHWLQPPWGLGWCFRGYTPSGFEVTSRTMLQLSEAEA